MRGNENCSQYGEASNDRSGNASGAIHIREMTCDDVPQVAAIEAQSFSQPWSEGAFCDALGDGNALLLAADETSTRRVVGYLAMYLMPPEAEITTVAACPSMRTHGIGTMLIRGAQGAAKARGIEVIHLEVRKSNTPAISLYHSTGFVENGLRKGFYDFPKEDALLMRWNNIEQDKFYA